MLNLMNCMDSKFVGIMPSHKSAFHTSTTVMSSILNGAPIQDKQFLYLKPTAIPCQKNTPSQDQVTCNNNKKKKRRRRRRKKNKKPREEMRIRQISIAESEDSFICFNHDLEDFESSSDSTIPIKKVHFASELCEIHPMVTWSFAYQAARKGPWEEYARDRSRFQMRIMRVEAQIGHIFEKEHRSKIYIERFIDGKCCDSLLRRFN